MFIHIKQQVQKRFDALLANGTVFNVAVDKEKIWDTYLNAFPEQFRQENTCNCCKSFIRQFAGLVGIKDNKVITLWDFACSDPEYKDAIKALRDYILTCPIDSVYVNSFAKIGTNQTPDKKRGIVWDHYFLTLPKNMVMREAAIGPHVGSKRDDKNVLKRSLDEITEEATDTVLEIIAQKKLYRGNEHEHTLKEFRKLQKEYAKVPAALRDNYCWAMAQTVHAAVCRLRNTSIGTLLVDISEGRDLDSAVDAFERIVAPSSYKRTTSLVTPAMIEKARKRLEELGLMGALNRRVLNAHDLNVNNALFVHRPQASTVTDVFNDLKKEALVNPKSLTKVQEIGIQEFIDKVLPTSKAIRVLVENQHMNNFVTLLGAQDPDTPSMFYWGNNFSWAYTGDVTDSIKERVKNAGGNVTGVLRISLAWHNYDDLDLHLIEPPAARPYHIYYVNKRVKSPSGGILDVDMNAGSGQSRTPVENICYAAEPKNEGTYIVRVNNFAKRDNKDGGFTVEIEYNGEVQTFSSSTNAASGKMFEIAQFEYTKKGGVKFLSTKGNSSIAKYNSQEKWGVKTGQFVPVRAITLSPNYWNAGVGNKHYMFLLEGCKSDETARPFFPEYLKPELAGDRKVFEILGTKVQSAKAEDELSGLGFSDTQRNHVFVEVEGTMKSILKVNF